MQAFDRRHVLQMLAAAPLLLHRPAAWAAAPAQKAAATRTDWSHAVIENMMARKPDPATLGGWGYAISLYLYGQYLF